MRYTVKPKLEETIPYAFDKKVLDREKKRGRPNTTCFYFRDTTPVEELDLMKLRGEMKNGGEDITQGEIQVIPRVIPVQNHWIPVYLYRDMGTERKPAVLFLHGGGFFGGDAKARENQCRYLAWQSGALVVSPDYRLAPECPYPAAVEDALGTLDWMTDHEEELNICSDRIAVAGDSAGANLAANCCLLDQRRRIGLAVYIYGALDLTPAVDTPYHWDYSKYRMYEGQKDYIMNRLYRFKSLTELIGRIYLTDDESVSSPGVSPLYAPDFSSMPKTVIIEAEFDYFRICNEEFAAKLEAAGREVEVILYEGMDHAFFDRLGTVRQAADCIEEMAERIKAM